MNFMSLKLIFVSIKGKNQDQCSVKISLEYFVYEWFYDNTEFKTGGSI